MVALIKSESIPRYLENSTQSPTKLAYQLLYILYSVFVFMALVEYATVNYMYYSHRRKAIRQEILRGLEEASKNWFLMMIPIFEQILNAADQYHRRWWIDLSIIAGVFSGLEFFRTQSSESSWRLQFSLSQE